MNFENVFPELAPPCPPAAAAEPPCPPAAEAEPRSLGVWKLVGRGLAWSSDRLDRVPTWSSERLEPLDRVLGLGWWCGEPEGLCSSIFHLK